MSGIPLSEVEVHLKSLYPQMSICVDIRSTPLDGLPWRVTVFCNSFKLGPHHLNGDYVKTPLVNTWCDCIGALAAVKDEIENKLRLAGE